MFVSFGENIDKGLFLFLILLLWLYNLLVEFIDSLIYAFFIIFKIKLNSSPLPMMYGYFVLLNKQYYYKYFVY